MNEETNVYTNNLRLNNSQLLNTLEDNKFKTSFIGMSTNQSIIINNKGLKSNNTSLENSQNLTKDNFTNNLDQDEITLPTKSRKSYQNTNENSNNTPTYIYMKNSQVNNNDSVIIGLQPTKNPPTSSSILKSLINESRSIETPIINQHKPYANGSKPNFDLLADFNSNNSEAHSASSYSSNLLNDNISLSIEYNSMRPIINQGLYKYHSKDNKLSNDAEEIKDDESKKTNHLMSNKIYTKDPSFLPKQSIIRKAKKNDDNLNDLTKNQELNIIENNQYSQLNGYLSMIDDPLEKFDQDYLRIISSFDSNELENAMPVTYNSNTHSYNIKITSINLMKDITREFYYPSTMQEKKLGKPSCLLIFKDEIIVGTLSGSIQIFDLSTQKFKLTLSTTKILNGYGSVTSFDIIDEFYLVSGYENGNIVIWDYSKKTHINTISNIHNDPVTSLRIIQSNPLLFISADCIGSVALIEIQKVLLYTKVENTYIFSQSAGLNIVDIKILNRDVDNFKKVNYIGDEEFIIAFASLRNILFISLEPTSKTMKTIHKFMKPSFVENKTVPNITWCNNVFNEEQNSNKNYILIGWGNSLSLLEFDTRGKITKLKGEGVIKMNFQVIFSSLISNNLIFSIASKFDPTTNDITNSIHIIHTAEFKKTMSELNHNGANYNDNNNPNTTIKEEEEAVVIYNEFLDNDYKLLNHKYIKDQQKTQYFICNHSVYVSHNAYKITILGDKTIYTIKLMTWKEYLDDLIENCVWKMFFSISLEILNYNIKELADIPHDDKQRRELLMPYFRHQLSIYATKYIISKKKPDNNSLNNDPVAIEVTKTIMDFCLASNMEEFLFVDLKKAYMVSELNELFLSTLEPFIKTNRITTLVADSNYSLSLIREIVYYYSSPKLMKKDLMQQMISTLHIEMINIDELVNLCLELNLYIALIYLCTRANDFRTPLIRFMGECSKSQREGDLDNLRIHGSRCLWYIKMCFKRNMIFRDDKIPINKWKNIVYKIAELFMADEYLRIFFNKLNPVYSINIIGMLFEDESSKILESSDEEIKNNGYHSDNSVLMPNNQLHYKILESLADVLMTKTENETQRKKNKLYASFICAKMIQNTSYPSLDHQFCLDAAEYIIKMHTEFDELIIINYKIKLPDKIMKRKILDQNDIMLKQALTQDYILESKSDMILALLKYSTILLMQIKDNYKKIVKLLEVSPFVEPLCYLLTLEKEFKKAFEKMLDKNTPTMVKSKAIEWAFHIIDQLEIEKNKKSNEFKSMVFEHMYELALINPEQAYALMHKYYVNREREFILSLKENPEAQLVFLENFLEENQLEKDKNDDINNGYNDLKELHILLLCKSKSKTKRKYVLSMLKKYQFYTSKFLEYCNEYQIKDALAFLLEKQGGIDNIQRAIRIKLEIFEDYYIKCIQQKIEIPLESELKIKNKFEGVINILNRYDANHDQKANIMGFWLLILQKCIILNNQSINIIMNQYPKAKHTQLKLINEEIIEKLLLHLTKKIDIKEVLEAIGNKSSLIIDEEFQKSLFKKLILNTQFENKLKLDNKILTRQDLVTLIYTKFLQVNTKILEIKTSCDSCGRSLKHKKCYSFACGHSFHMNDCINPMNLLCKVCWKSEHSIVARHLVQLYNQTANKTQNNSMIQNPNLIYDVKFDDVDADSIPLLPPSSSNTNDEAKIFNANRRNALLRLIDEEKNRQIRLVFEYGSKKIINPKMQV